MITVNTYEAKTRFSELLRIVNEKKGGGSDLPQWEDHG